MPKLDLPLMRIATSWKKRSSVMPGVAGHRDPSPTMPSPQAIAAAILGNAVRTADTFAEFFVPSAG
jgi:hypothetical protein